MTRHVLRWRATRQLGTFAGLVALSLVLWAATPHFLTVSNLLNVLEQTSINAIVAVGMTFVIVSGGIDLSVGSVLALSGIALARALEGGLPAPVAIGMALLTGLACGVANGAAGDVRTAAAVHRHTRHDERGPRRSADGSRRAARSQGSARDSARSRPSEC